MTLRSWSAYAPSGGLIARRLGDEMVIVNLGRSRIYELNPTATRLWELLADGLDVPALARRLAEEYDVDAAVAEDDVVRTLGELADEGLVLRSEPA